MKDKTVWVLKTISKDKTSYNGKFKWNTKKGAINTAKDYKRTKECGHGLHGALKGEGDGGLFSWDADALWLVLEVKNNKDLIQLDGKVKFKTCKMIYAGTREKATEMIYKKYHTAVIGSTSTSGDRGTSTSGDYGTSTSGYKGTSTSGDEGTSTSGYKGTSTSGDYGTSTSREKGTSTSREKGTSTSGDMGTSTSGDEGTATSGDYGTSTSGDWGTSTSGDWGTATSGDYGTSTSGDWGTSTSGDWGTSTSGYKGTSTSGYKGTSTSGKRGIIQIKFWDSKKDRHRFKTGYIGEEGLKPNVKYKLDENNEFEEVEL
ncbi:MAG TPA: hypothetical protein ENG37_01975 [Firmicutes bacterium]|nr:hypothetical protein [Bacillota bacterium]